MSYMPNKNFNFNTKHKKANTNIIKKENNSNYFYNNMINKKYLDDNIINIIEKIKNNKFLFDKISYLQLWWKTMFLIIKIQKHLKGFLYRIKLLKLLEIKENIVYGTIKLKKIIKNYLYKKINQFLKDKIFLRLKNYFNIWKSLIIKKIIIEKLKQFYKSKLLANKYRNKKKIKSESTKKRNTHNEKNKTVKFLQNFGNCSKKEILESSNKKEGLHTSRVNTEKNIHRFLGAKNNLTERKSKRNIKNNINKRPCIIFNTSSNILTNKRQNQLKKYKFNSKNNFSGKLNKNNFSKNKTGGKKIKNKNTYNRNQKMDCELLDPDLNKYKSHYYIDSNKKIIKNILTENPNKENKQKKNSPLDLISFHENKINYRQIYYNNLINSKKKPIIKLEKLDFSFCNIENNNKKLQNEKNNNIIRPKSMESRNKKKKTIENNINDNNNKIDENKDKNIELINLSKKEENKEIKKNKTISMKTNKENKNIKIVSKSINKTLLPYLNIWRIKNINNKIFKKLRSISILKNKIKLSLFYKEHGSLLLKSLQKLQKHKIISEYFNIYKNIIFKKIILQKLKDNFNKNSIKKKDNINEDKKDIQNNVKNEKKIIEKKIQIIEISPSQDRKKNYSFINKKMIESKNIILKIMNIRQNIIVHYFKEKYFLKWKEINKKYNSDLRPLYQNIKDFYSNYKTKTNNTIDNENQGINSSYHRKRVKIQQNINSETSFNYTKLYSKKIVNYNDNSKIGLNKEDYLNKSQPQISNNDNYNNSFNITQYKNNNSNLITSLQNANSININKILRQGVYKKKRIINSKNSIINKSSNNMSCVIGEVNKSNLEISNAIENEEKVLNNSMVIGRKKIKNNNDDIYYPKQVNQNLLVKDQLEFYNKNKNSSVAYKKMNIRYQKMNYESDLNKMNIGLLEEQTNEGTNSNS